MTGSCFSTKITKVSFWNIMESPFICGRDDMDFGFQNILYILSPYVFCIFTTDHNYFIRQRAVFVLKLVLFFQLSSMEPNMFVVNLTAFNSIRILTLINIFIEYVNYKISQPCKVYG